MRGLLAVIVLVVVVFFVVPMIAEGTTDTCKALEKQDVSTAATNIAGSNTGVVHNVINSMGQAVATGQVASTQSSEQHPNTPSPITCTFHYWKNIL